MKNQLAVFNFGSNQVRTFDKDGLPWFVALDVCNALGYKNSRKALADHLDVDERCNQSLQRGGDITLINESGLYALVLRSRKPEARKFAKWVTSEVLPAIRKTGTYSLPATISSQQQLSIRGAVNKRCAPNKKAYSALYNALYHHFQVAKYQDLPAHAFNGALSFIETFKFAPEIEQPDSKLELLDKLDSGIELFKDQVIGYLGELQKQISSIRSESAPLQLQNGSQS